MAYEKIGWNDYDDDLSLEENIERHAVATDTLLNRMDEGIAKANNVSVTVETTDAPSVEIVDNEAGDGYTMNFGIPKGEKGDKGDAGADGADGAAATVTVGEVTTGEAGTDASVTNSGTENAAVLDFVLPKGEKGDQGEKGEQGDPGKDGVDGAAATVTVGEVTTLEAGEEATVTNSGTENAAVLDFAIPKGEKGDQGEQGPAGADGAAATIEVGSVASGDTASVENAGTESSAVLNFVLPKGDKGDQGEKGDKGDPFSIAKTYASVDEMNEDFDNEEVAEGQFVVIATGDVNDEDNAKLYVKGADSFTFITDLSGADGLQGPAGADGAPGADGADGVAATIVVGQVTTGEAGTDATVTNSGTANAAVLDFVIPKGEKGDKGDQGDPGQDGAEGAQGPEGPQGPQGDPGADGADGAAATVTVGEVTTGEAGTDATVTNSGTENAAVLDFTIPKGEKGDKGDQGDPGQDGAEGAQGPEGPQGPQGDPGQDGADATIEIGDVTTVNSTEQAAVENVGTATAAILNFSIPKGEKGDKGDPFSIAKTYASVSAMNDDFSNGEVPEGAFVMIDTGNVDDEDNAKLYVKGADAFSYITDLSGATGITGPAGADGAPGQDGAAATIQVGQVTTGEAGTDATVTNSGTSSNAVLDFVIPKGEKGDKGDKGDPGQDGAEGAQGPEGPQGDPGADGADGAAATVTVGEVTTLEAGEEATVTNSGTENAAVLDFAIPKGEKGDKGDQGAQGPEGPQGPAGADGAPGANGADATIEIGDVTTVDSKEQAAVKNVGTATAAILNFSIPKGEKGDKGDPFTIKKTYASVSAMNDDFSNGEVPEGAFVMIDTGNVEDEDNAKLYVKGAESFTFITDLSGATGITGPAGADGAPGQDGAAATIQVGEVTTGEAGTDATVTNSGNSTNAVLDFVIPKGEKGDKGDKGDPGQDGAEGAQGPEGPQGPQGDPGADGADGTAATITVGQVTTLEAGEEATVTNSGTENAAVLDFAIPKGEKGDKGDQGDPGAEGPQGPAGADGAPGADGAAATVTVGDVTTVESTEEAAVENVGTATAAILNFSIPKGEKGDSGIGKTVVEGIQLNGYTVGTKAEVFNEYSVPDISTDDTSVATPNANIATGKYSHAEGYTTKAYGDYSHAEGHYTTASGNKSHSEGFYTTASGLNSHAEGANSIASGSNSHAEGNGSEASGVDAHAEGSTTTASGRSSHSEGINTIASGYCQHVQGQYNIEDADGLYAHIVGWGSRNSKKNIHTITTTGDGWFAGKVSAGTPESPATPTEANDLITKKYFEDNSTAGLTGEATSIEAIVEPTTASTSDIATKVNEIIAALKARGVVL